MTEAQGFDFGQILILLKHGDSVRRVGWSETTEQGESIISYLKIVDGDICIFHSQDPTDIPHEWNPDSKTLLAEDWIVVE